MKQTLEVRPGQGLGVLDLGMTRAQVYDLLKHRPTKVASLEWIKDYHLAFDEDRLVFIEIPRRISKEYDVVLEGIKLFDKEVDELMNDLSDLGTCWQPEKGYTYIFKARGLGFWRPVIFDASMLTDPDFLALDQEGQEEERRHMYFETISVSCEGYYGD